MMSMPYLTVRSLSSTTLVLKQSQFHCRIVRQCLFCSGMSVLRSTAAGWLVALCTDAQRWQVHASAALNLCRASWVSLAHFTWIFCRSRVRPLQYSWKRCWNWVQMIGWDPTRMVPVQPEQMCPGLTSTSPALRISSRRCRGVVRLPWRKLGVLGRIRGSASEGCIFSRDTT